MEQPRVLDYINNVISLADSPEDFDKCNFALLCDKYPIQIRRNKYLAKVIYISLQSDKYTWRIYPDKIKEYNIEHVVLTTNSRRRLHEKMNEFFVNGDNNKQEYNENTFYNYSIEFVSKQTKTLITQLREKYNLITPTIFQGQHQPLVLE